MEKAGRENEFGDVGNGDGARGTPVLKDSLTGVAECHLP